MGAQRGLLAIACEHTRAASSSAWVAAFFPSARARAVRRAWSRWSSAIWFRADMLASSIARARCRFLRARSRSPSPSSSAPPAPSPHLERGQRHQRVRVGEAGLAHDLPQLGDGPVEPGGIARGAQRQRRARRVERRIPAPPPPRRAPRLTLLLAAPLHQARVVARHRPGPCPSDRRRGRPPLVTGEQERDRLLAARVAPVAGPLVPRHLLEAAGELLPLRRPEAHRALGRHRGRRRPRRAADRRKQRARSPHVIDRSIRHLGPVGNGFPSGLGFLGRFTAAARFGYRPSPC